MMRLERSAQGLGHGQGHTHGTKPDRQLCPRL
jgi:hypothetical protein